MFAYEQIKHFDHAFFSKLHLGIMQIGNVQKILNMENFYPNILIIMYTLFFSNQIIASTNIQRYCRIIQIWAYFASMHKINRETNADYLRN